MREFDAIAVYDDRIILNETKATDRVDYVTDFVAFIQDGEGWMRMVQSRILTSHTYNEDTANEIGRLINEEYAELFFLFEQRMDELLIKESR